MGEINNLLNKKVKNVTLNRANTYRLFRSAIAQIILNIQTEKIAPNEKRYTRYNKPITKLKSPRNKKKKRYAVRILRI